MASFLDSGQVVVDNRAVSRRLLAGVLLVSLQLSAISSPLTHVHLDDHDTVHHHGREAHSHIAPHHHGSQMAPVAPLNGPAIVDDDDDGRVLDTSLFLVVRPDVVRIAAVLPLSSPLPVPSLVIIDRLPLVSHALDPPELTAVPPRAPPASLSLSLSLI